MYLVLKKKLQSVEPLMLFGMAVIIGLVWAFVGLADEVLEGDTRDFDTWLLLHLRDPADSQRLWGPGWVQEMMRDISGLGSTIVVCAVAIGSAIYLALRGQKMSGAVVIAAAALSTLLSNLLKFHFDRPRPDLVPHGVETYTASFPSGHALLSAMVYLMLGALMAEAHSERRLKIFFMALAMLLTTVIGLSRIYFGVHWPSDILAGWMIGAVCALIVWLAVRFKKYASAPQPSTSAQKSG